MFQEFSMGYEENTNATTTVVEKLIHHTAKNPQLKYEDFNVLFPKYPSYIRRATMASAYGKWSSWRSNYLNWEKERTEAIDNKKKFTKKVPTSQFEHNDFPVLYKGNMYSQLAD